MTDKLNHTYIKIDVTDAASIAVLVVLGCLMLGAYLDLFIFLFVCAAVIVYLTEWDKLG